MGKKLSLSIFLSLLSIVVLFWSPLREGGVGLAAKAIALYHGAHLDYEEVTWRGEEISFRNVCWRGEGASLQAEEAKFTLTSWRRPMGGKLHLEKPHLSLREIKRWKGERRGQWLDLSFSMTGGTFECPLIEQGEFSYHSTMPGQLGRFTFQWGEALLSVEGIEEGERFCLALDLEGMSAPLLQQIAHLFFPEEGPLLRVDGGKVGGRIFLEWGGGSLEETQGHLSLEGLSFAQGEKVCRCLEGSLEWERLSFVRQEGGRLKALISHLEGEVPGASFAGVEGELTFHSRVGTRFELRGIGGARGETFPLLLEGRAFFGSRRASWADLFLSLGKGRMKGEGREGGEGLAFSFQADQVMAPHLSWLQSIGRATGRLPQLEGWEIERGEVNLRGDGEWQGEELAWAISSLEIKDVALKRPEGGASLESLRGGFGKGRGEICFQGGDFHFQKFEGEKWKGGISWEGDHFSTALSGVLGGVKNGWEIEGSSAAWSARGRGEAPWEGELLIAGREQGDGWALSLREGKWGDFTFAGEGIFERDGHYTLSFPEFQGSLSSLFLPHLQGKVSSLGAGAQLVGDLFSASPLSHYTVEAKIERIAFPLNASLQIERGEGQLFADEGGFSVLGLTAEGVFQGMFNERRLPLYAPVCQKKGELFEFDVRALGPLFDLARLKGEWRKEALLLDAKKSHFLDAPLDFSHETNAFSLRVELPWIHLLRGVESLGIKDLSPLSGAIEGNLSLSLSREGERLSFSAEERGLMYAGAPFPLSLHLKQEEEGWRCEASLLGDLSLSLLLKQEGESYAMEEGRGKWSRKGEVEFFGKVNEVGRLDLHLPKIALDLEELPLPPFAPVEGKGLKAPVEGKGLKGTFAGEGHLSWDGELESDFDFVPSSLSWGGLPLENRGKFHVDFSSDKGAFIRGVDLWGGDLFCKVELIHFDRASRLWNLSKGELHLPAEWLPPSLRPWVEGRSLDLKGDLSGSADGKSLTCSLEEGELPLFGGHYPFQQLTFSQRDGHLEAGCFFLYQKEWHTLHFEAKEEKERWEGRLLLGDPDEGLSPLAIEWEHEPLKGLWIRSVEGNFGGIGASFHTEGRGEGLIGSARLHFRKLSSLLPPAVAEVFSDLEMGGGYEIKGRLHLGEKTFQGILSGKELELFGYQLRTLLGELDIAPDRIHLYNVKVSDHAGTMKIPDLLIFSKESEPWRIQIPEIRIAELRPALLRRPGEPPGPISPLVVRELTLRKFEGILEDGKTYTAKGDLRFINSYKREHTLFDIPSDVLGRIFGLDLELLIPVKGLLDFELRGGYFHLTSLKQAFSEGERSEFFLVDSATSPRMDLKGNLSILIKMKQFVLFKFTESFLISIDGTLEEPKFHLQKKGRFLG